MVRAAYDGPWRQGVSSVARALGRGCLTEEAPMFTSGGAAIQVIALCIAGGVRAVYMTNNPDKLARWSVAEVE